MQTRRPRLLFLLISLAIAVYAPVVSLPFIATDYISIPVGRVLGLPGAWSALLTNAHWHFHITQAWANAIVAGSGGFMPRPFYATSLVLHLVCVVLIYRLRIWKQLPANAAVWAAGFFAVYHGHHGAIMSLSNWPDLLATLWTLAALLVTVVWLNKGGNQLAYASSIVFLALALVSSESAVFTPLLLMLPALSAPPENRVSLKRFAPHMALGIAALALQLATRPKPLPWAHSLPVLDPFWISLVWAAFAAGLLFVTQAGSLWRVAAACGAWVAVGLVAQAYLTWILNAPGETAYFGSAGLALLVGIMFSRATQRLPIAAVLVLALTVLSVNAGLVWTRGRRQMLDLGAPTEALNNAVPYAQGPLKLSCFPYPVEVAQAAIERLGGRAVLDTSSGPVTKPHCVSFSYKDAAGAVRQFYIRSAI